ncbi:MAG: DUF2490 domain-containing protein [Bryobacter sp.]|nr:DUF2490 domain-containing protein [Bryobacter sp.]
MGRNITWIVGLLVLCAGVGQLGAQTGPNAAQSASATQPRGWISYFGDHRLGTKGWQARWGFHFDGQYRASWADGYTQLLLRPGLNFYVKPNLFLTFGQAYIRTRPDSVRDDGVRNEDVRGEQRLWQQLQWMPRVGKLTTVHHFRQEQRWVPGLSVQDRFRYFFRTEVPAPRQGFYLALQSEIFVKGGRSAHARFYDQNRAYTAIGKRFTTETTTYGKLEAGYLYQHVLRPDGRFQEHNHVLVLSFLSTWSRQ